MFINQVMIVYHYVMNVYHLCYEGVSLFIYQYVLAI